MLKLSAVHFDHLKDEDLEDVYSVARALERDLRGCGAFAISSMVRHFATECALELNVRDVRKRELVRTQLTLDSPT